MDRSSLLYRLEQVTGDRIDSVAHVKRLYPALKGQALGTLDALEDLVKQVENGAVSRDDLLSQSSEEQEITMRKSALSIPQMREMKKQGRTLQQIADAAGITRQAVSQHLKK